MRPAEGRQAIGKHLHLLPSVSSQRVKRPRPQFVISTPMSRLRRLPHSSRLLSNRCVYTSRRGVFPGPSPSLANDKLGGAAQVRFHRSDYEGPGSFEGRETGSNFGHLGSDTTDTTLGDLDEKKRVQNVLQARFKRRSGDYTKRGYTIGIGGPVGSGKTALTLALCQRLRQEVSMGVVTNDIFTQEDAEFLVKKDALGKPNRIIPVETGGCPHAAIREDVSANLGALEHLTRRIRADEINPERKDPLLLCESGGDNLAANFSSELADYTVYVIDVAGGDKVPRKGGPGITQSDLLVINKIDLAEAVGASLEIMKRDAGKMRCGGPTVFSSVKEGEGVDSIISHIMHAYNDARTLVEKSGLRV